MKILSSFLAALTLILLRQIHSSRSTKDAFVFHTHILLRVVEIFLWTGQFRSNTSIALIVGVTFIRIGLCVDAGRLTFDGDGRRSTAVFAVRRWNDRCFARLGFRHCGRVRRRF